MFLRFGWLVGPWHARDPYLGWFLRYGGHSGSDYAFAYAINLAFIEMPIVKALCFIAASNVTVKAVWAETICQGEMELVLWKL